MSRKNKIDVRPEQRRLLAFECRSLRPNALIAIDETLSKGKRLAAIASLSAAVAMLAPVTADFADKLSDAAPEARTTCAVVDGIRERCEAIALIVDNDGARASIVSALEELMAFVDTEHARAEAIAREAGASVISFVSTQRAESGGGKGEPPNAAWLTRALSSSLR